MFDSKKPEVSSALVSTAKPSPITLEQAIQQVDTWLDLSPTRRRDLRSDLNAVRRICEIADSLQAQTKARHDVGVGCTQVIMDCRYLRARLFCRSPKALGLRPDRFATIKSSLRAVMRRMGLHTSDRRSSLSLTPDWQALHEALRAADEFRRVALIGFIEFCSSSDIRPDDVENPQVDAYRARMTDFTIIKDPNGNCRGAVAAWNWARSHIHGWPQMTLAVSDKRQPYTLPLTDYPASFQADVAKFERDMSSSDPEDIFGEHIFDLDGHGHPPRRRAARASTVKTRLFQIRQAAAALVISGVARADIRTLRDLVAPTDRVKTILTFFHARSKGQKGSATAGIAEVLRQLAKFHCGLPAADVSRIAGWATRISPDRQTTMSPKNRRKLQAMVTLRNSAMLHHLPRKLMDQAASLRPNFSQKAARLAQRAVAIELLTICPMRVKNLNELQINVHLLRNDGRQKLFDRLSLAEADTKNHAPIEWPIPLATARLIEVYITQYRPILAEPGSNFLFPGTRGPLAKNAMAAAITMPIAREIGIDVNPHLMRHFAAYTFLKQHPGQYEIVRRVLGHKDIDTTIGFYCGLEAEFAAVKFDKTVLGERTRSRGVAAAAFARPRLPGGKPGTIKKGRV